MKKILILAISTFILGACVNEDTRNQCREYIDYSNPGLADFACGFDAVFNLGARHW